MDNLRAAAELTAHGTQQAVSLRTNMTALASVFTGSSHQDTMSLSLPLVKEWSTNIKTFVHDRMTLLDAISAGSASFDILCRPGVYTLYIASMTNKVPFHPMSGSHEVTNVFNNKYGDDPDGTNMHFKSIFPPAGINSLGIDFTLSHLSSSLSTLDAVRSAVHGTAHHAPKLKIIFELTCQAASDFYDALYHDFPGILNKEHFQFTLFHWLFMRWAQRIQAPYSFSATDIQPFAAMLKYLYCQPPRPVDNAGHLAPTARLPSGSHDREHHQPIACLTRLRGRPHGRSNGPIICWQPRAPGLLACKHFLLLRKKHPCCQPSRHVDHSRHLAPTARLLSGSHACGHHQPIACWTRLRGRPHGRSNGPIIC